MSKIRVAASLFLLSLAPAFAAEPTTGPLAGTTAAHNGVRQKLNASMPPVAGAAVQPVPCGTLPNLVWDDTVAATAQNWANICTCNHESNATNPYGENIAWGGAVTGTVATNLWASEVANPGYDYVNRDCPTGSPTFPGCGHYTQVAWANTTRLGCGYKACGAATGCGAADYVVCRYDPPGNFQGADGDTKRPYCTATEQAECANPNTCPGVGPCSTATALACGVALNGSAAGAISDFDTYSCSGIGQLGPDVIYSVTSPNSGTLTVDLTTTGPDFDLFALSACDGNSCLDNSEIAGAADEQVTFAATAGQTYYLVVEDFNSSGGNFTLTATCPPCTAPDGTNLTLANDTVTNTRSYHVCETLTAGPNYVVMGPGGDLTLRANGAVVFVDGFSVGTDGSLEVRN